METTAPDLIPAQPPPRRWNPLAVLACFLIPAVVFSLAASRVTRLMVVGTDIAQISAQELFVLVALVDIPLILGTLALARWLLRARPRDLGFLPLRRADLSYGLKFGVGLFAASIAVGLVQAAVFGKQPQAVAQALAGHSGIQAVLLDLVSIAVLTPIAEELLFRGLLFGALRQRFPFIPAAAATSLLFTVLHEPQAWPGVFVLGFGMSLAYERTRTLWAPIATHATVNAIPLILLAIAGPSIL